MLLYQLQIAGTGIGATTIRVRKSTLLQDSDELWPCVRPAAPESHPEWPPSTTLPPYVRTHQAPQRDRATPPGSKCTWCWVGTQRLLLSPGQVSVTPPPNRTYQFLGIRLSSYAWFFWSVLCITHALQFYPCTPCFPSPCSRRYLPPTTTKAPCFQILRL